MSEHRAHDFILDIAISKKEYFCRITNKGTGRTHFCRTKIKETDKSTEMNEISLVNFARSIHYILSFSADTDIGMGMNFLREKIRTYIHEGTDSDFFSMNSSGATIGIFITWEDESDET